MEAILAPLLSTSRQASRAEIKFESKVRSQVGRTVADPKDMDEEIGNLLAALAQC
jgi:hypothetical protein